MDKKEQKQLTLRQREWEQRSKKLAHDRFLEEPENLISGLFRGVRIFCEYMRGFYAFRNISQCITFFGSARFDEDHKYYKLARETAKQLAEQGFSIMTGGGPGIMEAANRGAKDIDGHSIGCNILITEEQMTNPYLDRWITFKYFFVRKVMLTKYSSAFIVMPGGFGTMDEMFEMETLIQTGKINEFPVIMMGIDYWKPLFKFISGWMVEHNTIDQTDVDKILITDSPEKAVAHINKTLKHMKNL